MMAVVTRDNWIDSFEIKTCTSQYGDMGKEEFIIEIFKKLFNIEGNRVFNSYYPDIELKPTGSSMERISLRIDTNTYIDIPFSKSIELILKSFFEEKDSK